MKLNRMGRRSAFTMIELVFVIVVMGILAKFGVELFLQIYENYTRTTITASLMSKSEAAISQIANRLTYRLKDSVIVSNDAAGSFQSLSSAAGTETVFEWIGLDNDGWDNGNWSGVIDLYGSDTNRTQLGSPGTSSLPANGAILFAGSKISPQSSFGWHNTLSNDLYRYNTIATAGIIPMAASFNPGDDIFEFYQVARSAYALVLNGTDLTLYYNYYPWQTPAQYYTSGQNELLVDHVSTFTLQKTGDIIKIELCLSDNNFMGEGEYSICKTKIVF